MRGMLGVVGGFLALLCAAPAAAAVIEMEPTSDWGIDYSADSCALSRNFGAGNRTVGLEIRQFSPTRQAYRFSVRSTGMTVPSTRQRRGWAAARFYPGTGYWPLGSLLELRLPDDAEGATFPIDFFNDARAVSEARGIPLDRAELARSIGNITGVELQNVFNRDVLLNTGSFVEPMRAMQNCMEELQQHWGIDVEAHRNLTREATPRDMQIWAERITEHYPSRAMVQGRQAVLHVRLDISAEGLPTGCHIQEGMGEDVFQQTACELLLANAVFDPALDSDGNAIASYFIVNIDYRTT